MTSPIYSPRPTVATADELQLSSPGSFRLFSEGVLALNNYEQSAEKSSLEKAKERLTLCVRDYPRDMLPQFYLAIVASLLGDMDQQAAIELFEAVQTSRIESLRLPAKYNLAATYIEKYNTGGFDQAELLLSEVVEELRARRKSLIPLWRKMLPMSRPTKVDELLFQAWAVLLYVKVHHYIWEERQRTDPAELDQPIKQIGSELESFQSELYRAGKHCVPNSSSIQAEYLNAVATYDEALAHLYRQKNPARSSQFAQRAREGFECALTLKPNWVGARANLARVHGDLLGNVEEAIAMFSELVEGTEDVQYSHYNLGKLYYEKGEFESSIEHYSQASSISGAQRGRARAFEKLGRLDEARADWNEILKKCPEDPEATTFFSKL